MIFYRESNADLNFKITDLGLAIVMQKRAKEVLKCGSPGFIAPEILNKEGYDLKADVFSCGIILYLLYRKFIIFF